MATLFSESVVFIESFESLIVKEIQTIKRDVEYWEQLVNSAPAAEVYFLWKHISIWRYFIGGVLLLVSSTTTTRRPSSLHTAPAVHVVVSILSEKEGTGKGEVDDCIRSIFILKQDLQRLACLLVGVKDAGEKLKKIFSKIHMEPEKLNKLARQNIYSCICDLDAIMNNIVFSGGGNSSSININSSSSSPRTPDINQQLESLKLKIRTFELNDTYYPLGVTTLSARMPSYNERLWLRNLTCIAGAVVAGSFLYRNKELVEKAKESVRAFFMKQLPDAFKAHVVVKCKEFLRKFFRDTQGDQIVSEQDIKNSQQVLSQMVDEYLVNKRIWEKRKSMMSFYIDHSDEDYIKPLPPAVSDVASSSPFKTAGMDVVNEDFKIESNNMISGLLFGNLRRNIPIHAQKYKVHGEAALLETYRMVDSNKLTVTAMAAIPGIGILYLVGKFCIWPLANLTYLLFFPAAKNLSTGSGATPPPLATAIASRKAMHLLF